MACPDLTTMEAVAKTAAQGGDPNWRYEQHHRVWFGGENPESAVCKPYGAGTFGDQDAVGNHIATFNPAAMLELLAYIQELETKLEYSEEEVRNQHDKFLHAADYIRELKVARLVNEFAVWAIDNAEDCGRDTFNDAILALFKTKSEK